MKRVTARLDNDEWQTKKDRATQPKEAGTNICFVCWIYFKPHAYFVHSRVYVCIEMWGSTDLLPDSDNPGPVPTTTTPALAT